MKDKHISVFIDGEERTAKLVNGVWLEQGDYIYKENDKWYLHKERPTYSVKLDKKIEPIKKCKLYYGNGLINESAILKATEELQDKINEIIEVINGRD